MSNRSSDKNIDITKQHNQIYIKLSKIIKQKTNLSRRM